MNRLEAMVNREQLNPVPVRQIKVSERQALSRQMEEFLARGGEVEHVPFGVSGQSDFAKKRTLEESRDRMRQADYRRVKREPKD